VDERRGARAGAGFHLDLVDDRPGPEKVALVLRETADLVFIADVARDHDTPTRHREARRVPACKRLLPE